MQAHTKFQKQQQISITSHCLKTRSWGAVDLHDIPIDLKDL